MSLERIIKTLEGFGFNRMDAEVYVFLSKKGPQKEKDITEALKISNKHLYSVLKKLQYKGVITRNSKNATLFSAIAIEKVIDIYIKTNIEQAQEIKKNKEELLANWHSVTKQENT